MTQQDLDRIDRMRKIINKALLEYSKDASNASAGYDILRYARMGYLKGYVK